MKNFKPNCMALLIGSLPIEDHEEATKLILKYTPDIPLWAQLPKHHEEGMIKQFLPGMPGLTVKDDKIFINAEGDEFENDLLKFYEDYMLALEDTEFLDTSRFALTQETAKGFFNFTKAVKELSQKPTAVKGQISGPITMGIGITDHNGRVLFYDDRLKDVLIKLIALKARWQVNQLSQLGAKNPPIVFFDEPGVVSFGSSAFISITRDDVNTALTEVIDSVHEAGGLAGIHICANGDWSMALETSTDIISFDAYSFFDKLILYKDQLKNFIKSGGILAWGIVPTSNPEDIEKETFTSLFNLWKSQFEQLEALGLTKDQILSQTLITPSCGTGSISPELATKVLAFTKEISEKLRKDFF
ncbi:Methionine synthase [Candidatus Magnetomoraceae bacterium gMMP-15]